MMEARRESEIDPKWRAFLIAIRSALLMIVAEIEKLLDLPPKRK